MKNVVAIYARLSREDEEKIDGCKDSRSIENQIKVLSNYAKENNMIIYKIYYDDGYTGSNMNRPGIISLIEDAKKQKFNTLLIKDISRLGRVLHQVGQLIDDIFPKYNIRVISLNDNYDSSKYNDDESIVLRNFLNDYYLKDFKRKCAKSLEHRAHTQHLNYYQKYGYYFDKDGKEQIDEYASQIVKFIFNSIVEGKKLQEVADILNNNNILSRTRYITEVLKYKTKRKIAKYWEDYAVRDVIKDYEYCGHSINLVKSEKPIIIKNTHHKIIDEQTYFKANQILHERHHKLKNFDHIVNLLYDKNTNHRFKYVVEKEPRYRSKYIGTAINSKTLHDVLYKNVLEVIKECTNNSNIVEERYKNKLFKKGLFNKEEIENTLTKLNIEFSELVEKQFYNKITQIEYINKSKILSEKIKELEIQKEQYNNYESEIIFFKRNFNQFLENIKQLPTNQLEILRMTIGKVLIDYDKETKQYALDIYYKFEIM